jgi:hypothetical protein
MTVHPALKVRLDVLRPMPLSSIRNLWSYRPPVIPSIFHGQRPAPDLNEDILNMILEPLYFKPNTHTPDYASLCKYARVSRVWRLPVQRLLFQQITIQTFRHYEAIAAACNPCTMQGRFLADCVRILDYQLRQTENGGILSRDATGATVFSCFEAFPFLYELRVNCAGAKRFNDQIMKELRKTPPIQALRIDSGNENVDSVIPFQLLQIENWPLEHLAMIGIFDMEAIAKYPPARRNLYELRLPSDPKNGRYSTLKFVKAVMAAHYGSKPALEILHTRDLEIVTPEAAQYLRSLLIADCHPSLFSTLPKLPMLRELIVTLTASVFSARHFTALSPFIQHIGLTAIHAPPSRQFFVDLLHDHPGLRVISLYFTSGNPEWRARAMQKAQPDIKSLQKQFMEVEFRLYDGPVASFAAQVRLLILL